MAAWPPGKSIPTNILCFSLLPAGSRCDKAGVVRCRMMWSARMQKTRRRRVAMVLNCGWGARNGGRVPSDRARRRWQAVPWFDRPEPDSAPSQRAITFRPDAFFHVPEMYRPTAWGNPHLTRKLPATLTSTTRRERPILARYGTQSEQPPGAGNVQPVESHQAAAIVLAPRHAKKGTFSWLNGDDPRSVNWSTPIAPR
jgi:hypothetical protein